MSDMLEQARGMSICILSGAAALSRQVESSFISQQFRNICSVNSLQALLAEFRQRQAADQGSFDLLVLLDDVQDTTVVETCRMLADEVGIVIMTTAEQSDAKLANDCYRAGALDYLPSSIAPEQFITRVALVLNLLRERRLRNEKERAWETELAERRIMEARLKHLVDHDDLTGLANRRRLEQALELAIIRARNFQRTNALLYLDLDKFKAINDSEGHDIGDHMLIEVANKIRAHVDDNNLVARIGSDEFAILLEQTSEDDALRYATELQRELSSSFFKCGSSDYQPCVSIGLVVHEPHEDITVSQLLARAEHACHAAKSQGRNTVYKFTENDEGLRQLQNDAHWVPIIRKALAEDQFFLMFQPIMNIKARDITHYEALIRMRKGDQLCSPTEFIPVAERMGLIHQIDLWVVERAMDFLSALPPENSDISISINLSSHAFQLRSLLPLIKKKLELSWISPGRLTFEITETAAVMNFTETREMVARLRALGCKFALDDFGSGFSSFSYIKNYPVDFLKIDGSFIINLLTDETDQLLVKSMIDIAHNLGKRVIAECVQNQEVLDKLVELGVDYVQGYHVGNPQTTLPDNHNLPPVDKYSHPAVESGQSSNIKPISPSSKPTTQSGKNITR